MRLRSKNSHHEYTFATVAQLGLPGLDNISVDASEVRLARNDSEYGAEETTSEASDRALAWMRQTLPLVRAALVAADTTLASRLPAAPQ